MLDSRDIMEHEGLPVTSIRRTILDLAKDGNLRFAGDALSQARREGYITEGEHRRLAAELRKATHEA
jgi:hypothetical protein